MKYSIRFAPFPVPYVQSSLGLWRTGKNISVSCTRTGFHESLGRRAATSSPKKQDILDPCEVGAATSLPRLLAGVWRSFGRACAQISGAVCSFGTLTDQLVSFVCPSSPSGEASSVKFCFMVWFIHWRQPTFAYIMSTYILVPAKRLAMSHLGFLLLAQLMREVQNEACSHLSSQNTKAFELLHHWSPVITTHTGEMKCMLSPIKTEFQSTNSFNSREPRKQIHRTLILMRLPHSSATRLSFFFLQWDLNS